MADRLHSNWTLPQVLAALSGVRRIDDGTDLLAFRVVGASPTRAVYVYLFGEHPDVISFDLEDEAAENGAWDQASCRGETRSLVELQEIVGNWLREPS